MNKKRFILSVLSAVMCAALVLTGCKGNTDGDETATGGEAQIKAVYATIAPVYDFTRKIAGDKQQVKCMVSGDLHNYEPSAAEMAEMESASMVVYNGLEIDSFVHNISDNMGITFIDTSMGAEYVQGGSYSHEEENVHSHEAVTGERDPHIWLYPPNAKIQLSNIRDALIQLDEANADIYNANYDACAAKCDDLDAKFKTLSGKTIVTTHGAYAYWQEKYGINVYSMDIAGEEVSPAKMKEIVEFCNQNSISVIYYEATGSDKTAKAVAAEIGGTTRAINSFEAFLSDNDDYFTIMEQNYEALK